MSYLSCIISNVILALLLALAAWMVQRWLRWPAAARILWVLALVKLVTPPLVLVPLVDLPASMACALGACNCAHHADMVGLLRDALPLALLAAWAVGAIAMGWTAWRRWAQFRRLLSHATEAPAEWQALAARLSSNLSIRCPEILSVPGRLPPLVVPGWRRPRMLLPVALLGQLDASQRAALLLHELAHIKRGDHLVRMLELMVSVAFWWLPISGSIGRHLRACEESCCDAAVVAHLPQGRRDYARLLLDVIDFANPLSPQAAPQATAMSVAHDLEQRLRAILDAPPGTRRTWPTAVLAAAMAIAILPCKLHYDFSGRQVRAAASEGCERAAETTSLPSDAFEAKISAALCCPS